MFWRGFINGGVLAAAISLVACASAPLQPVPGKGAGNQLPFGGLRALAEGDNAPPVRMFLVHGMSNHEPGWSARYLDPIAKELHWSCASLGPPVAVALSKPGDAASPDTTADYSAKLQIYALRDARRIRAIAYELTWSPLTINFKKTRLSPDDALEPQRTIINGYVKEKIFNEDMSDVVLYLARYDHDILRRSVRAALADFYRRKYDPPGAQGADGNPVVFLSESLGSMMLYGGLMAAQQEFLATAAAGSPAADQAAFDDMVRHSRLFLMMANQLPLLDVDENTRYDHVPAPSEKGPLPQAMEFFGTLPKLAPNDTSPPPPAIDVVAFSDLNDILSYPLDPADVQGLRNVRLHLFAPVNTLMGFPFFERPDWAHTNYADNPNVTAIVVNGYAGGAGQ